VTLAGGVEKKYRKHRRIIIIYGDYIQEVKNLSALLREFGPAGWARICFLEPGIDTTHMKFMPTSQTIPTFLFGTFLLTNRALFWVFYFLEFVYLFLGCSGIGLTTSL
jgi:hypothetical protein